MENSKINLAVLLWPSTIFGGAERRFSRLAAYLAESKGVSVTIFCHSSTVKPLESLNINMNKVKIERFDTFDFSFFPSSVKKTLSLLNLLVNLKKDRFDYFFIASNPGIISYITTRFSFKLPKIIVGMTDITHHQSSSASNRFCVRQTMKKVHSIDCLSPGVKESYSGSFDSKYGYKIKVAPCSYTDYSKVKQSETRDIDVVLISRFVPFKGHELLESIANELPNIELHVCGDGSMPVNIKNAKIYKTDDPFSVLSRAKISLSLQKFGNYPSQVVLESLASSCAVIATDVGETRMFLNDSNSILIDYDPSALLEAIKLLLADENLRAKIADSGRKSVLQQQTIERYSNYFLNEVCC
jgi:glycosyltransferase involved in cell wall biosynthesis